MTESVPVAKMKSKQIAAATVKDTGLQRVIQNLRDSWPTGECQLYHNIRAELRVITWLLPRKNSIVIPQSLRPEILKWL